VGGWVSSLQKQGDAVGGGGLSSCLVFVACFCSHPPLPFLSPSQPDQVSTKEEGEAHPGEAKGELTPERRSTGSGLVQHQNSYGVMRPQGVLGTCGEDQGSFISLPRLTRKSLMRIFIKLALTITIFDPPPPP
jgi:hypothetical protein